MVKFKIFNKKGIGAQPAIPLTAILLNINDRKFYTTIFTNRLGTTIIRLISLP